MRRAAAVAALAGVLLLGAAPAPRAAARTSPRPADALRVAALTERILKLQAQEGVGVLAPRARRASGTALRQLEASVRAVGVAPAPAELHESTALLAIVAAEYRTAALRPPSRENARRLGERAEEVAWEAAKVSRLLADDPLGGGPLAARAEEASALAQRIARLLLWKRWGIAGASWAGELALGEAGLESSLAALRSASGNTPETLAELQLAENQAAFLLNAAHAFAEGRSDARDLEGAVKASDNAHESLERLAALYAARGP